MAVLIPTATHFIHADHLSTLRVITDTTHKIIWRWDNDPFGTALANEDPDGDGKTFTYNLRFPGQYFDKETGLHYNYFRDYNPKIGRYVQSDPIGLRGGLNTYAYVGNNPLYWIDPYGLATAIPTLPGLPIVIPPVAIPGTPENQGWVDIVTNIINNFPAFEIQCIGTKCIPVPTHNENADEDGGSCPTPDSHQDDFIKLKGGQGYKDKKKHEFWNKDKLHKDHWDVSDRKGNKVKEIDFNGNQIWPSGPKNKNK